MRLSTKVRYAVRAMAELARQGGGGYVPLRVLAAKQNLSVKYLEQMAGQLRIGGLVQSVRGAEGGYRLARPAEEITVWDIYCVLDTATELVDCEKTHCADGKGKCTRARHCAAQELWGELSESVQGVLKSWTLARLAKREERLQKK